MQSFHHFQNQAQQKPKESKFSGGTLNLSGLMEYAGTAKKQGFEALCRLQPLVKTYQSSIKKAAQAMQEAESALGEAEIPPDYAAALIQVKESFAAHLKALDQWTKVLAEKKEAHSDKAMTSVKQTGKELETALEGLSVPKSPATTE